MAHRVGRPGPNQSARSRPLAPNAEDTHAPPSFDSDNFSDSDGDESARLSGLAASFRIVSESLLRMEQTELEMAKAREALRLTAEKRLPESEAELTQILFQAQLQIASLVSRRSDRDHDQHHHSSRKRKRAVEEGEENDESACVDQKRRSCLKFVHPSISITVMSGACSPPSRK